MPNIVRQAKQEGRNVIGSFINSNCAAIVEVMGFAGFDFVIIDNEHSSLEADLTSDLIRAAECRDLCALARVREVSRPAVMKLLDVGAKGLIIPNITSLSQVQDVIKYGKYPPLGQRGYGAVRTNDWASGEKTVRETMDEMNDDVIILPQCETVEALAIIEDIVSLEGVDGIFIGPFDLSVSMGIPGEFDRPEFQEALQTIIGTCRKHHKICMKFTANAETAAADMALGVDAPVCNTDLGILINAGRDILKKLR